MTSKSTQSSKLLLKNLQIVNNTGGTLNSLSQ